MSQEFDAGQLTYLNALGIDVWIHREQLLAEALIAQDSSVLVGQQPVVSVTAPAEIATERNSVPADSGFMAQASEALKAVVAPAHSNVNPSLTSGQRKPITPQQTPRFNLQFWCYSSGLWFVSCHDELLPEHHKFVHNLAQYVQGKRRRPRHVGIFSWPMIDSPNIDQGVEVAKKYLQQHMEQVEQLSSCSKLIALDGAAQWLPSEGLVSLDLDLTTCLTRGDEKQRIWKVLLEHKIL